MMATTGSVAALGEAGLLERIRGALGGAWPHVALGIGDDAALLRQLGPTAVVCADMLVEEVDFSWAWAGYADVGHKAAAVALSDLAAMGAQPRGLLVCLALGGDCRVEDVLTLLRALHAVGAGFGAPVVGGDLSSTRGPLVLAVTAVGAVEPGAVLRRHGARVGDRVLVSGPLGGAAAGLQRLRCGEFSEPELAVRQLRPTPRVALGRALGAWGRVTACADISDGLVRDCAHLVEPGCGVVLRADAIPCAFGVAAVAQALGVPPWQLAACGGEDFELVFSLPPGCGAEAQAVARASGSAPLEVGVVVSGSGVRVEGAGSDFAAAGFDHFADARKV